MENIKAVKSQLTMIVRGMYSNPPNHGARVVSTILNNTELKQEWLVRNKKEADSCSCKLVLGI